MELDGSRILALTHSVNLAGAQLALASLIKNTYEQIDWVVVCPAEGPFVEKIDDYAETRVVERYPWWCKGRSFTGPPTQFEVGKLNQVFNSISCDVALTNTITVPWLAYNAYQRSLPHMWYIHEYGDLDHNLFFPLGYDRSVGYINRVSDTVLTVSRSVGEHLLGHGITIEALRYIGQSFDVDAYLDIEPASDTSNLLILGSIKESKGQLDALTGFGESTISRSHKLTIAGPVTEERYADEIRKYIKANNLVESVIFIPERVDGLEQMQQTETVLVCSKNEALGRITLEALAAGRTVVGSRGGGTETLLAESRGILYDGTIVDLTKKLNGLTSASSELQPVARRKQYIVNNFSPANERGDFIDAVHHALQRHAERSPTVYLREIGKTGIMSALKEHAIIA